MNLLHLIIFSIQILFALSVDLDTELCAVLPPPELIKAHGYPSEIHNTITDDGYILELHRIANPGKQPVILVHGFLDSSAAFILLGPKHSLGYILYDQNYDVWLPNTRGNDYSNRHIKYHRNGTQRDQKKYWNFSWHEVGVYDLAAIIDYVLKNTSYSKAQLIGHSQGATAFFVLTSERPEYNDKILLNVAMAPTVFMTHMDNSFLLFLSQHLPMVKALCDWIGLDEKWRVLNNMFIELPDSIFCTWDAIRDTQLCKHNFSPFAGNTSEHLSESLMPILHARIPTGVSTKSLVHFGQLIRNVRFQQFDYGMDVNIKIYNRWTPPDYNLKRCTAPVAIIYSDHDTLVAARDICRLPNKLSNVVATHIVDNDTFNHVDFILALDAKELVYDYIVDWMRMAEQRQNTNDM